MQIRNAVDTFLQEGLKLRDIERCYFEAALERSNYDKRKAASILGLPINTFYFKLTRFNSDPSQPPIKTKEERGLNAQERLGQLIREARERKDLPLKCVAMDLGYTNPAFISKIELGLKPIPRALAPKLSEILEIDLDVLNQAIESAMQERKKNRNESANKS